MENRYGHSYSYWNNGRKRANEWWYYDRLKFINDWTFDMYIVYTQLSSESYLVWYSRINGTQELFVECGLLDFVYSYNNNFEFENLLD